MSNTEVTAQSPPTTPKRSRDETDQPLDPKRRLLTVTMTLPAGILAQMFLAACADLPSDDLVTRSGLTEMFRLMTEEEKTLVEDLVKESGEE